MAETLRILDFESEILDEYADFRELYEKIKSRDECCSSDEFRKALTLSKFLERAIKESGKLPSFLDKLGSGTKAILGVFEERINTHDCVNCTLKHVSSAAVIMNEILNGYENSDHEIFLMGNLNEASEQIAETSLELSNELRNLRVDIFETEKKLTREHLRKVKEIYRKVRTNSDINIRTTVHRNTQTIKKPCGCKGN